jgi:hypothetical protein
MLTSILFGLNSLKVILLHYVYYRDPNSLELLSNGTLRYTSDHRQEAVMTGLFVFPFPFAFQIPF